MDIGRIHWLGHASFRIDGSSATIYIDPWKIPGGPTADLVLVTHEHFDHLSTEDVARVKGPETVVAAPAPCSADLAAVVGEQALRIVAPGDVITHEHVTVRAVPAYNTDPERQGFHPRDPDVPRVGYFIEMDGSSVYHTGDTDDIGEMEGLEPDLVLLPVGGTYTMTAEQAAGAARRMGARAAVPMHWGDIVGSRADAERFAELFPGETHLLEPE
jgi:L-ascorbate metabolism protein UlaG (beta-lactamase superfamily)